VWKLEEQGKFWGCTVICTIPKEHPSKVLLWARSFM
jgi:hypothetical protein